jgi:hypothetical protein
MSKTYFDNEPDNFVKNIKEIIKFHKTYGKKQKKDKYCDFCHYELPAHNSLCPNNIINSDTYQYWETQE